MSKKKPASKRKQTSAFSVPSATVTESSQLLTDLRELIDAGRARVTQVVNAGLTLLNWAVGDRIRREILKDQRAEYGEQIVATVSRQLGQEYGKGFSTKALWRMIQFSEVFPDQQVVQTLSTHLGWSHFIEILPLDDPLKRDFYAEMCRLERWSVRTLRQKIGGMLFERTAVSKKPEALIRQELDALRAEDRLTPDLVFRDPYVLDFLGLSDTYAEADLERAILRELEAFLLELGDDFCLVARQKRITVDAEDYYLDLLFYHRRLRRLVAIELKLDKFKPEDKGQMELYLRWLARHDVREGEAPPLGLILCAGTSTEHIELLELAGNDIRVAEYLTVLPERPLLERKLHDAIHRARLLLDNRAGGQP